MNTTDLLILAGSLAAVALMTGAAWLARIPRPVAPLDDASARTLLAGEFPDETPDYVWVAGDAAGVIARAGDKALILFRLGDSWVARTMPWALALVAPVKRGKVLLKLRDPAAPLARLAVSGVTPWPPENLQEAIAA